MRLPLTASIVLLSASGAFAGSIETMHSDGKERSIERIRCEACGPVRRLREEASLPVLAPGTQKIETRMVDGKLKIFRTEAWMGGSPVVYVSTAPKSDTAAATTDDQPSQDLSNVIDTSAQTSALPQEPGVASQPAKTEFDPAALKLRSD